MSTSYVNMFLAFVALAIAGGWVVFGLARVQAALDATDRKTNEMRRTFTATGITLLSNVETIQRLDEEIKKVKDKVATAIREQRDKHEALAKNAPPPPPETYVTSEYPPSQKELAWIASFMRDARVPQQPNEREPKPMLIWGHTQAAALHRARQLIQENKAYTVGNVGPFYTS
ncbi:MAG TPA: hypothetical protein VMQ11_18815 [Alphaproteobacteria bacterium]|nr:hypothetical protein [Alphaproteobacteria bacterium]